MPEVLLGPVVVVVATRVSPEAASSSKCFGQSCSKFFFCFFVFEFDPSSPCSALTATKGAHYQFLEPRGSKG